MIIEKLESCTSFHYVGPDMKTKKKYHVDTVSLNFPKKDMEVSITIYRIVGN